MMSFVYIAVTAISLTYNTYVHYIADVSLLDGFSQEIALQSILELPKYEYHLERARDFTELKLLMEIKVS
jgi:hypothetical protein